MRNRPDSEIEDPDGATVDAVRVQVRDGDAERPFMRGILVHSLTSQGFGFEEAYGVAQAVWKRVRDRTVVDKAELRTLIDELSSPPKGANPDAPPPEAGISLDVKGKDGKNSKPTAK